jgi:hypothetical protein
MRISTEKKGLAANKLAHPDFAGLPNTRQSSMPSGRSSAQEDREELQQSYLAKTRRL